LLIKREPPVFEPGKGLLDQPRLGWFKKQPPLRLLLQNLLMMRLLARWMRSFE